MATAKPDAVEKYLSCIHCGLCTSACPTYLELGSEADSPRGRIHLMRAVAEGRLDFSKEVVHHLELCLDCQACTTACPSGVDYGPLIEEARERIEAEGLRSPKDRALLKVFRDWIFPYPARMRAALAPLRLLHAVPGLRRLAERLPWGLGKMTQLAPPEMLQTRPQTDLEKQVAMQMARGLVPAQGEKRGRVALLTGCVGSVLFDHVNIATAYVLARNGYDVVVPRSQGCCGALHLHTGAADTLQAHAGRLLDSFVGSGAKPYEEYDAIIVNAAGCGSTLKQYSKVIHGDLQSKAAAFASRVKDISEFLAEIDLAPLGRIDARITYHDACHLLNGQGIAAQPRDLLARIPGITLVPLEESEVCCGSAGIYNILQPEMGDRLLQRKIAHLRATGARIVATGNPGCTMQIVAGARKEGLDLEVLHPVELLFRAYQAAAASTETAKAS